METSHPVFVFDASSLLRDPEAFLGFPGSAAVIPNQVIEDLERRKGEPGQTGDHARAALALLQHLRLQGDLLAGLGLAGGGTLRVHLGAAGRPQAVAAAEASLAEAVFTCIRDLQDAGAGPVTLVSADLGMVFRADAQGLAVLDYAATAGWGRTGPGEDGVAQFLISPSEMDAVRGDGFPPLDTMAIHPNQPVLLVDASNDSRRILGRYDAASNRVRALEPRKDHWGLRPRNLHQQFALDLLSDDKVEVVVVTGHPGTGKTMLAWAAGLEQVVNDERYNMLCYFRPGPVEPERKGQRTFVQRMLENPINLICAEYAYSRSRGALTFSQLLEGGYVSLESTTTLMGRTIDGSFVIIDEAQDLSYLELKSILAKAGNGSKVVLLGDLALGASLYPAAGSALARLVKGLLPLDLGGHVGLIHHEGSRIAKIGAELL